MTIKEYLSQAYHIEKRINSKLEQIASLRELATKATSTLSDMPHNPNRNVGSMENIICKMIDLENEINADIDTLINLKQEIMITINRIENPEYQTVLELRYLCFKTWAQIAANMCYSIHHLYKMHNAALEVCDELMEQDT